MIVVWLFLAALWVCLQFVIVIFPDQTHLLFWSVIRANSNSSSESAHLQDGPGLCFCPEFRVSVRRKNGYNPGLAGSEFG